MIAETLSRVINEQSQAGWKYVGADHFKTLERSSWFGGAEEVVYTVLVFERELSERRMQQEPQIRSEAEQIRAPRPAAPSQRREPIDDDPPMRRRPSIGSASDAGPAPGEFVRRRPRSGGR